MYGEMCDYKRIILKSGLQMPLSDIIPKILMGCQVEIISPDVEIISPNTAE